MKQLDLLYQGKAKSVYRSDEQGTLIMRFRDDITAFDGEKKDVLGGKGGYNTEVSAFFFRYLEERGIKTHFLGMIDPITMAVRDLTMIPLEVIVRNVAAGSIVRRYPFTEGAPLDPPVIVIDYKDDSRHDPMLNDDLILALRLTTREELDQIKANALAINELLKDHLDARGIILVDFKMEFGRRDGTIHLGDEISMDSMRLWDKETRQSMDKDVYRFNKGDVMTEYAKVAKRIIS
ncbi:phosphoribosylaminoimidazole-succinocarboxamide synthase [Methanoculleus taiwanensis]|uniref:Phosphoribosylaminoimidazole-succinocarboxamide synthase n=1 Tax=Methanoculleus taiwanensis TaxID=1550565 RepID=A0A498H4P6_9EURY|nr:phosphoribosylaminoimidazolesuccinocarboxamide synthase [Methanoculleus taiwanensis]RXE57387.1 phosphoribosylaminoimidazole-succinocarboxamide synthase [Methanoculleus taiwanensis]